MTSCAVSNFFLRVPRRIWQMIIANNMTSCAVSNYTVAASFIIGVRLIANNMTSCAVSNLMKLLMKLVTLLLILPTT
ncbi:MAG: hypothetical protein ACKPDJ_12060 [Dolichospermum sp.]